MMMLTVAVQKSINANVRNIIYRHICKLKIIL
jgi:hypothetical protein